MKYQTIVIDPPWTVKNNLKDLRFYRTGKTMPYPLMSDEEIKNFPIDDFADDRCDLFLWTITSKIPLCFEILKSWGFRYMDFFAWDKEIGVPVNGIYRRVEWVIYAYRGKMGINKKGSFIPSMFREKRGKHSRKPDIFYETVRNHTLAPRIDIFAREHKEGFSAWGNEVESDVELKPTLSSEQENNA
jgi:N6-adenosine-specific RNA methylase IME4